MISFQPTEEQEVVREAMRDFAKPALRPIARECDEASKIPDAVPAQAAELGLVSTQIPEAYGGGGEARSPITNALVLEELAWGDATLAVAALAPAAFAFAVADQGTPRSRSASCCRSSAARRFHAAALALRRADAAPSTRCCRAPGRAEGRRASCSRARRASCRWRDRASHFLVIARNNGGLDAFVVPRDAAGLRISRAREEPRPARAAQRDAHARAGRAARLGAARRRGRLRRAAPARALARRRSPPCWSASRAPCSSTPSPTRRTAWPSTRRSRRSRRSPSGSPTCTSRPRPCAGSPGRPRAELEHGRDATRAAHHARAYAAEKCMWIADEGVQVLGGHGFIREHPVEMWYRNARTLGVLEGTVGALRRTP